MVYIRVSYTVQIPYLLHLRTFDIYIDTFILYIYFFFQLIIATVFFYIEIFAIFINLVTLKKKKKGLKI